jgi:hypothetical protein
LLRAALSVGVQPQQHTLAALLAAYRTLENRPGMQPYGFAGVPLGGCLNWGGLVEDCRTHAMSRYPHLQRLHGNVQPSTQATGPSNLRRAAEQVAADQLRTVFMEDLLAFLEAAKDPSKLLAARTSGSYSKGA